MTTTFRLTHPALVTHVRKWGLVLLASLANACGGGSDTTEPPPPPPPGDPVPATLSVEAGDGQVAAPGGVVAVAPSVRVRTAGGQPVPSVTVAFVVDSGGGSVATPTALTDANGIAVAGAWTVGVEGPQVLTARVGTLPVVKIRATSRIPTTVLTSGGVNTTGGTITVSAPSSPLNGTQLTIPSGAFDTPATVTLSIRSTVGLVLKAGVAPVGPGLGISSTVGKLKKPATIRVPIAPVAGKEMLLAVMDMTTRRVEILPPSGASGSSLTAMMPALDASMVEPAPGAAARSPLARWAAAAAEEEEEGFRLLLLTLAVDPTIVGRPVETNFQMQRDNWDFDNLAIAWLPFLGVSAVDQSAAEEVIDPAAGMIGTALWYFENRKADGPLYKRFRLQPDQLKSNKVGIRWAALATRGVYDQRAEASRNVEQWLDDTPAFRTLKQWAALKAMMYFSENRPVPVLLYGSAEDPFAVGMGIAIRSTPHATGDDIDIYVPEHDLVAYRARITPEGMLPFTVVNRAGETYRVEMISPLMRMTLLDVPSIASNWGAVVAGTVGDAEGWPTPELVWEKGTLDTSKPIFLSDQKLQHWWKCTACTYFGNTFPGLPPNETHVQAVQVGRIIDGAMAPLPENLALASIRWDADSVASDVQPTVTGQHILLPQPALPDGRFPAGWLDWQEVTYRKVTLNPSPAAVEFGQDTTINVSLAPSQPLPSGTTFSWILKKGPTRDSLASATPAHARDLEAGDDGYLIILAHEAGQHKRIIARDSIRILPVVPEPFWKLTTFVDQDDLVDPPGADPDQGGPLFDLLWGAESVPGSALIAITGNALSLRVKRAGTWTDCCPPAFGSDDHVFPFPTWSQTTTDLTTGTVTGVRTEGLSTFSIEATRNGKIMTGTMTLKVSVMDNGELDTSTYVITFTAERMK